VAVGSAATGAIGRLVLVDSFAPPRLGRWLFNGGRLAVRVACPRAGRAIRAVGSALATTGARSGAENADSSGKNMPAANIKIAKRER
jgi:hypothetical protein